MPAERNAQKDMGVTIPIKHIKRFYRLPEEVSSRKTLNCVGEKVAFVVLLMMAASHLYKPPRLSEVVVYLILGIAAILLLVAAIIIIVERVEKKSISDALVEKITSINFQGRCVFMETSTGSTNHTHTILVADMISVSGYVQWGWLWVRDRGVVIETNDHQQIRLVLSLKKSALNLFLKNFQLSLGEKNYPVRANRVFQI